MPRFAANLTMMFNEVPFLERFGEAAQAGFRAVEFLSPYDYQPNDVASRAREHNLEVVFVQGFPQQRVFFLHLAEAALELPYSRPQGGGLSQQLVGAVIPRPDKRLHPIPSCGLSTPRARRAGAQLQQPRVTTSSNGAPDAPEFTNALYAEEAASDKGLVQVF